MKIDNMSDNIPTGRHMNLVVKAILRLQTIYNISADDIMSGNVINEMKTPFSLDDAFDIARVAYDVDQCYLAIDWLKFVTSHYDKQTTSFNKTNALNLLASAYLKVIQNKRISPLNKHTEVKHADILNIDLLVRSYD